MQILKRALCLLLLALCLVNTIPAMAEATAAPTELERVPCRVIDFLTGNWGKIIATIVIIFSAFMMLFGKLSIPLGMVLIAALAMLFGAESVLTIITGSEFNCKEILNE